MRSMQQILIHTLCSLGVHSLIFSNTHSPSPLENDKLRVWIEEVKNLCLPEKVHICDGSEEEFVLLSEEMVKNKSFILLSFYSTKTSTTTTTTTTTTATTTTTITECNYFFRNFL